MDRSTDHDNRTLMRRGDRHPRIVAHRNEIGPGVREADAQLVGGPGAGAAGNAAFRYGCRRCAIELEKKFKLPRDDALPETRRPRAWVIAG